MQSGLRGLLWATLFLFLLLFVFNLVLRSLLLDLLSGQVYILTAAVRLEVLLSLREHLKTLFLLLSFTLSLRTHLVLHLELVLPSDIVELGCQVSEETTEAVEYGRDLCGTVHNLWVLVGLGQVHAVLTLVLRLLLSLFLLLFLVRSWALHGHVASQAEERASGSSRLHVAVALGLAVPFSLLSLRVHLVPLLAIHLEARQQLSRLLEQARSVGRDLAEAVLNERLVHETLLRQYIRKGR